MDEQTKIFIENILPAESEVEQALRIYAEKNRVPILRSDAAAFMRTLVSLKKPMRILEVGTAIGYSSILCFLLII